MKRSVGVMERFFKSLEENRKKQMLFFCVCMMVLIVLYLPAMQLLRMANKKANLMDLSVVNDVEILSQISGIEEEKGKLKINGWITRLDSRNTDVDIVLENDKETDIQIASTECCDNEDMQELFGMVVNNKNSGFQASIKENVLVSDVCYRIQIVLSYIANNVQEEKIVRKKIFSGKYLFNGELYSYNPLEFFSPSFADEEMCQVIEDGVLRGYNIEKQAWIYQYQEQLYLIVGNDLYTAWEGDLEVPYHLWTTQNDKLPEYRKDYGFDNRDFRFRNNEINVSSDNYHVAVISIPEDYPIANVRMGIFDSDKNEWIWETTFSSNVN